MSGVRGRREVGRLQTLAISVPRLREAFFPKPIPHFHKNRDLSGTKTHSQLLSTLNVNVSLKMKKDKNYNLMDEAVMIEPGNKQRFNPNNDHHIFL